MSLAPELAGFTTWSWFTDSCSVNCLQWLKELAAVFTATPPGTALIAASCRLPCHCSVQFKAPWHWISSYCWPSSCLLSGLSFHWWPSSEYKVGLSADTLHLPVAATTCVIDAQLLAGFSGLLSPFSALHLWKRVQVCRTPQPSLHVMQLNERAWLCSPPSGEQWL